MGYGLFNVTFGYGAVPLFEGLTLELPAQGALCLCGPSGCGKSTLLRLLCGLETPAAGTVAIPARPGVVFQENALLPWRTVADNVALPLRKPAAARVRQALEIVELTDAAGLYPEQLSGGMARRAAIARALAYDGEALLLDEPFNGLDPDLWQRLCRRIRTQYAHRPVLLITHEAAQAEALGARLLPFDRLSRRSDCNDR